LSLPVPTIPTKGGVFGENKKKEGKKLLAWSR